MAKYNRNAVLYAQNQSIGGTDNTIQRKRNIAGHQVLVENETPGQETMEDLGVETAEETGAETAKDTGGETAEDSGGKTAEDPGEEAKYIVLGAAHLHCKQELHDEEAAGDDAERGGGGVRGGTHEGGRRGGRD